jgi:hypothetical protein
MEGIQENKSKLLGCLHGVTGQGSAYPDQKLEQLLQDQEDMHKMPLYRGPI